MLFISISLCFPSEFDDDVPFIRQGAAGTERLERIDSSSWGPCYSFCAGIHV